MQGQDPGFKDDEMVVRRTTTSAAAAPAAKGAHALQLRGHDLPGLAHHLGPAVLHGGPSCDVKNVYASPVAPARPAPGLLGILTLTTLWDTFVCYILFLR